MKKASDRIISTRGCCYGNATREFVLALQDKYQDLMMLRGDELDRVTKKALLIEIQNGTVKSRDKLMINLRRDLMKHGY